MRALISSFSPHCRHQRVPMGLEKKHFDTWLNLFYESVDEHFSGKTATLAKTRAGSIADLMLHKINSLNKIKE